MYDVKQIKPSERVPALSPRCLAQHKSEDLEHLSPGLARATRFTKYEEPEDFKALVAEFRREFQPATFTEKILVEKMAQNQWHGLRTISLQEGCISEAHHLVQNHRVFGTLVRSISTFEKAFYRAKDELVKLQEQRKKSEIGFESKKASASLMTAAA